MGPNPDPFELQRFVDAQDPVFNRVLAELTTGRKASHWMWFVFPQLRSLGRSAIAQRYGIRTLDEAIAYGRHPVLGPRLVACAKCLDGLRDRSAHDIFGTPDDLKLRSCLTLFERAMPTQPLFARLLERYHAGKRDALTLDAMQAQ